MEFEPSNKQTVIRRTAREFASARLAPVAHEPDQQARTDQKIVMGGKKNPKKIAANDVLPATSPGSLWEGVWVFGDIRSETQRKATVRLLEKARVLAALGNQDLSLLLLGSHLGEHLDRLRSAGADNILVVDHPRLKNYAQETYVSVLECLVINRRPDIFLFLANDCGRELAPRLLLLFGVSGASQFTASVQ